jgi:hypothetical protein
VLEAPGPVTERRTPSGIAVNRASQELLDAILRMTRLLDHPDDAPALAPAYEREILWRLIARAATAMTPIQFQKSVRLQEPARC